MIVDCQLAVCAERSAGHEWPPRNDARVADQIAAGRIVRRVHNHIIRGCQLHRVCRCEALPVHVHLAYVSAFRFCNPMDPKLPAPPVTHEGI